MSPAAPAEAWPPAPPARPAWPPPAAPARPPLPATPEPAVPAPAVPPVAFLPPAPWPAEPPVALLPAAPPLPPEPPAPAVAVPPVFPPFRPPPEPPAGLPPVCPPVPAPPSDVPEEQPRSRVARITRDWFRIVVGLRSRKTSLLCPYGCWGWIQFRRTDRLTVEPLFTSSQRSAAARDSTPGCSRHPMITA